ncbi:fatty acyl-CoA reductase wat [Anopheles ziemanni]|uniref:fatty acyl-CoA reductase wat n=1 Tax=Anopheles coustani TaxID=139045 RepID=UPI002658352C|nr:fatty acyl-CoA reductase wat [Anopheles coustani]XP_058173258.1 fatty acyl-CoA reductase wat [Anopheles ziemanni]
MAAGAAPTNRHGVEAETSAGSDRVLEFYRDATVLVTGGTGFLGKVLLEKILRCLCVRKVFLLIRPKNSRRPEERLQELLKDAIFDKLRQETSTERLLERLEAVEISLGASDPTGLGIDPGTEERLLQQTEVILNVLASVKFNECLSTAIGTNVGGTRRVLLLARRMHRLRSMVHVSTLYSNCDRTEIGERVYPDVRLNPDTVLQLSTVLSPEEMDGLQHCLVGALPNTYTFSKKCAETLIQQQFSDLPVGIFRPPIVLSTYREPIAGWTDNLNGPAGLCLWTVKGYVHVIWGNRHRRANLVPVDYCVNAMLVAGYDVAERWKCPRPGKPDGDRWEREQLPVPVYNYMYDRSNLTWGRYMSLVSLGFDGLLHRLWWNLSYTIVPSRALFRALSVCCHTVPARLLDVVRRLRGKSPRYGKLAAKTTRFLETMSYFGLREWTVANENVVRLRTLLSPTEAGLLEFDLSTVDWDEYFRAYIPGVRRYVLGEPKPPTARWSARWSRRIHFLCRLLHKLLWILLCLKLGHRLYVVRHLFGILIS